MLGATEHAEERLLRPSPGPGVDGRLAKKGLGEGARPLEERPGVGGRLLEKRLGVAGRLPPAKRTRGTGMRDGAALGTRDGAGASAEGAGARAAGGSA